MGMRRCGLAFAALLAACAATGKREASAPARSETPVASQPTAEESRPTLAVSVRAHDGSPLRLANVSVRRFGFRDVTAEGTLEKNGELRLAVEPGLYTVSISGVDHAQEFRVVLVENDVRLSGKLGTYARQEAGQTIPIRGEYVDAEGKPVGSTPSEAKRTDTDRYRLDLPDPPASAAKIRYQLRIGDARTANAPGAESYEYDGGGDYWSVAKLPADGSIDIDLSAWPPKGRRAAIASEGDDATIAALREPIDAWQRERRKLIDSMPRKDGKILAPTDETNAAMDRLVATARADCDAETDARRHTLLRASRFAVFGPHMSAEQRRTELRWFVDHVPVDDPRLGLAGSFGNAVFLGLKDADPELVGAAEAWLERLAREQPEPGVAVDAFAILMHYAAERAEEARVSELYELASARRLSRTYPGRMLARMYDPARVMQRGKPLPDFDFAALGEPKRRITKGDRLGKLYLVEFWATWCGPCVAEMPKLHETYAAINGARHGKGKGDKALRKLRAVDEPRVEFLFVSLDGAADDVVRFRGSYWSMPWTHAFVGGGLDAVLLEKFGFSGVPTAILVDERGNILEYGSSLRNEKLLPTLERALAAARNAKDASSR